MGGPNVSRAMRTLSMARTTPAQKPRGLSNKRLFPFVSENVIQPLFWAYLPTVYLYKLSQKAQPGQRKPQKSRGLALFGLIPAANGVRHGHAASARHCAAKPRSGGPRLTCGLPRLSSRFPEF